ncbi:hypothetical protein [Burkholderia gladioli]|uniref:hypothetical protein n=1 Tax=Burkholderia gladioli TaxID=28095 RepID=UPI001641B26E|nr:hypothetical protein [Burkholderia gladioli]MDN7917344.1 hypothetical protein [Burkholderia gladioli]
MTIEIRYVKDVGNLAKERVVLKVSAKDDIGRYILFDTAYFENGTVSNEVRHTLWFPDKEVNAGDLVVAYTKTGADSQTKNENGTMSHFFYMNKSNPIWRESGNCVVLIEAKAWKVKPV